MVVAPPPEEMENLSPLDEDERFTVVDPVVTGFPDASWRCTVIGPSVALLDAVPDTG